MEKTYKQIAHEIINKTDMMPLEINVTEKHLQRIQQAADAMGMSISEAATFLMYAHINDIEALSAIQKAQTTN